ncbi:MAG: hypothetical protein NTW86_30225 [Candidatus Sumerlaeota bacterium]|nr:hypothetical protein [Candidatus Sumerlaeota bacterium]
MTSIQPAVGVFALFLLAAGASARAAEPLDENSLRQIFDRAARQDHSIVDAETAIRTMREQIPNSKALPQMEFDMGRALWLAYAREGFTPADAQAKASLAMEHLERFLPGGAYASFGKAGHACAFYAEGLLTQGKADEARTVLLAQIQTGKPSAKATAFKALTLLRDVLSISDDELAAQELAVQASVATRKAPNRIGDEFLGLVTGARDPSAVSTRLFALTRLHMQSAGALNKVKRPDLAKARYREAVAAGEAYLSQCPTPSTSEELARWLRMRLSVAVGEFFLGDARKCLELSAPILDHKDDPAFPIYRPAVEARLFWNQCRESLGLASNDDIDADLTALLATGKCRAEEVNWCFEKLAAHARQRGDMALEYLYWRDIRDRQYDLAFTLRPARKVAVLEQKQPDLKETPPEVRSPANDAMEAAGLTVSDASQLPKAGGRKKATKEAPPAIAGPQGSSPTYYKTFALPLEEESDEAATPAQ